MAATVANDFSPVFDAQVEVEPKLLLDVTRSMRWPASANSKTPRKDVVGEALGAVVEVLTERDSQAAAEKAAGKDAGGLDTVLFAGGSATHIDDLSPDNWRDKWNRIVWDGGTLIMPGWDKLMEVYLEEFNTRPKQDRPILLALVITDGEAEDTDAFIAELARTQGSTYACVVIVGFGDEHDKALAKYQAAAANSKNVRIVSFDSVTTPATISDGLLSLLGAV